jgi:hypothetical protein
MKDIRHLQIEIRNILLYSLSHPERAERCADELVDRIKKRGNSQDAFIVIEGCGNLLKEDGVASLVEKIAETHLWQSSIYRTRTATRLVKC